MAQLRKQEELVGIRTGFLETDQLRQEIQYMVDFLTGYNVQHVQVLYGVGCATDQLYEPIPVVVLALPTFIQTSIDHGIYHLGDDDLYVESASPSCQFLLCHEHDLHVEAVDAEVLRTIKAAWKQRGYAIFAHNDG